MAQDRGRLFHALTTIPIAAVAVSWAAIFIRFAEAPPLVVAFYRMLTATVILAIWMAGPGKCQFHEFDRRTLTLTLLSGLFLALHFAFWISSLAYTPVANSVVLVTTSPIFAAVFSHLFLKEEPRPLAYLAILLAIGGGSMIMGGDVRWAPDQLLGDLLSLAGAVMAAAYFLIGRAVQRSVSVFPYIFTTYGSAAVFLGVIVIVFEESLAPYPAATWLWFLLLGLIPQVIGHSLYNRALRFFKAHVVGAAVLVEPIGATILAYFLLAETPPWYALLGAIPIFAGVGWTFWLERHG